MATASNRQCWLLLGEVPAGPFKIEQLHQKLTNSEISWQTMACEVGDDRWYPLLEFPDFGPRANASRQQSVSVAPIGRVAVDDRPSASVHPAYDMGSAKPSVTRAESAEPGEWSPQTLVIGFRCLIAADIAVALLYVLLYFVGVSLGLEPEPDPNQAFSLGDGVLCLGFLLIVPATIASWVGLFMFRDWGRRLYIAIVCFSHFVAIGTAIFDVSIHWQLPSAISGVSDFIGGAIVAMVYFSPVSHEFRRERSDRNWT